MKSNERKIEIAIAAVAVVIILILGWYVISSKTKKSQTQNAPTAPTNQATSNVHWEKFENKEIGLKFEYPKSYEDPKKTYINSKNKQNADKVTGNALFYNFNKSQLVVMAETEDYCSFYDDQLYSADVCRKADFSLPRECWQYQDISICKNQTFKNSFEFIARKKYENQGYTIYFEAHGLDACESDSCPAWTDVVSENLSKIEEFIAILNTINLK